MTDGNVGAVRRLSFALVLVLAAAVSGCGGKDDDDEHEEAEESKEGESSEHALTAFQLEHGIGPVKEKVEVGAIDQGLAAKGKELFELKCSMCHKMDTLYVGPSLGEVTARRSPAYVMNMILNPQEMVERHPIAKQLLAERMTFMPNQQLTLEDSRAILEYLRTQAKSPATP